MQVEPFKESFHGQVPAAIEDVLTELLRQEAAFSQVDILVEKLQQWTDCRCVGMRLFTADGLLAYSSYLGFSPEFWVAENLLSVHCDSCACTRVVTQQPEPQDMSMMTAHGSFHCNQLPSFVRSLTEEELSRYRGKCLEAGFHSLTIIPLMAYERVVCVLHLADERPDQIPEHLLKTLESLAPLLGSIFVRHVALVSRPRPLVAYGNLQSLLGGLKAVAYVVDPTDYRILYTNQTLRELLPSDPVGEHCYQQLYGRSKPCADCSSQVDRRRGRLVLVRSGGRLPEESYLVADRAILWSDKREVWLGLGVPLLNNAQLDEEVSAAQANQAQQVQPE